MSRRRQVDQERDGGGPAWLRGARVSVKDISSHQVLGRGGGGGGGGTKSKGSTAWVEGKKSSKRPSAQAGVMTFKGSAPPAAKDTRPQVLNTVTRASLNPEFLNVLDEVMGEASDEDYEEPEVDYLDIPDPDYDDPPKQSAPQGHKPLTATSSSSAATRSASLKVATPPTHKPLEQRHSTGNKEVKQKSIGLQTEPVSHSSAPTGLDSTVRDFAPNLRVTAAHQAKLLREAGRGGAKNGQRKTSGGPVRRKTAPSKHVAGGATNEDLWNMAPAEASPPGSVPGGQNKVLNNLQKAMDSGWFYGYGIVVKNLKERLEYISKHHPDKPRDRRKSVEITRHRDKVRPEDSATYEAGMSRELAVEILRRQRVGSYILRDSLSSPGHLAISVKTTRGRDPTVINHFLLLRTPMGGVSLKGFSREWPSIKEFTASMAQTVQGRDVELCRFLGIR